MADGRFAMAAVRVSRNHGFALHHMRDDAMRDSILSRSLSRCVEMESARIHSTLRPDSV